MLQGDIKRTRISFGIVMITIGLKVINIWSYMVENFDKLSNERQQSFI